MQLDDSLFEKFGKLYQPGQIIFSEYEPGDNFYFILHGTVRITKIVSDKEKTLDTMSDGDIFGEMAILEAQPRSATVIAETEVKVLEFNKANFEMLLQSNPQMALKLLKIFCNRIYDAKRQLMVLTLQGAEFRVADVFLLLAEKKGIHTDERLSITLKVSTQEIANMCALSTDEVEQVINSMIRQNKIEKVGNDIKIHNISEIHRTVINKRKTTQREKK